MNSLQRAVASFLGDLRSGLRALLRYPVLSVAAIVTFGLGLGISTSVFTIVNGVLYKGIPLEAPDRLVALFPVKLVDSEPQDMPVQDLTIWQSRQTVFEALGAYSDDEMNLSPEDGHPAHVDVGELTVAAFAALKVSPEIGRGFQPGDDRPGAPDVVLLGDGIWRTLFDAAPGILNKAIHVNGVSRVVIGIMPPRFAFPDTAELWVPLQYDPLATERGKGPQYSVIGRLKAGVSLPRARAQAQTIAAALAQDFPKTNTGLTADVQPYIRAYVGQEAYALLYTMLGAGIGVLLIACVNVSNLLIARASLRGREVAVRLALGAHRTAIIRQHLTEVVVLALGGGAIGGAITVVAVRWFSSELSKAGPPAWMTFGPDYRVALFVGAMMLVAAIAAGGLPAWHASRTSPGAVLKDESRSSTGTRLGLVSSALVVAELAVSCGLLIGAGLMIKSVVELRGVKKPVAVANVLAMAVQLPLKPYSDVPSRRRLSEALQERLAAIPGIEAVTIANALPGTGSEIGSIEIAGHVYGRDSDYPSVRGAVVGPRYFETFNVGPVRGRLLVATDDSRAERVAVINESMEREYFPGTDPVGQRFRRGRADSTMPWLTVVGVVPDLQMQGLGDESNGAGYYRSAAQDDMGSEIEIVVRTSQDIATTEARVREGVRALDPDLPVYDVRTMTAILEREVLFYGIFSTLFVGFGIAALLLAAAGLYGVVSFAVTQRTREMGVRSALGAGRLRLALLIMRRSLIQLAVGLSLGLALGWSAAGPLHAVLYRVAPHDPFVILLVVGVLTLSAIVATALPAWRVTKIDPVAALASE